MIRTAARCGTTALRPEIVESAYYLHHFTVRKASRLRGQETAKLDPQHYRQMGEIIWQDFVKYCRTDEGYAALKSVVTKEQADSMQSFLFAETFKYFYLLFASPKTLNFDKVIFNTEAHPIRRSP